MRSSHLAAVPLPALLAACACAALAAACAGSRPPTTGPGSAGPVADRDLGLSRTSVFDTPAPAAYAAEASVPGEKPPLPRAYPGAPPVAPHGLADLLPITQQENMCVTCHAVAGPKVKGEPTPLPASHYVDLRRSPGVRAEAVAGARWNCVACHAARTDAPPLVGSTFPR